MVTDELLKQLDTKDYSVSEHKDAVTAIDADAWIDALDAGRLTTLMKLNLLDTVGMVTAMVRVVARLADQSDFGMTIAREACTGKRWDELSKLRDKHGVSPDLGERARIKAVGGLLTDTRVLFWAFRILFSKAFIDALGYLVYDRDKSVRRRAIEMLTMHDGPEAVAALTEALDDTDATVQEAAAAALKTRLSPEALEALLAERQGDAEEIGSMASDAKQNSEGLLDKIPGIGTLMKGFASMSSAISSAASSVSDGASRVFGSLRDKVASKKTQ